MIEYTLITLALLASIIGAPNAFATSRTPEAVQKTVNEITRVFNITQVIRSEMAPTEDLLERLSTGLVQKYEKQNSLDLLLIATERYIFSVYNPANRADYYPHLRADQVTAAAKTLVKIVASAKLNDGSADSIDQNLVNYLLSEEIKLAALSDENSLRKNREAKTAYNRVIHELIKTIKSRLKINPKFYASLDTATKEQLVYKLLTHMGHDHQEIKTMVKLLLNPLNISHEFLTNYRDAFTPSTAEKTRGAIVALEAMKVIEKRAKLAAKKNETLIQQQQEQDIKARCRASMRELSQNEAALVGQPGISN